VYVDLAIKVSQKEPSLLVYYLAVMVLEELFNDGLMLLVKVIMVYLVLVVTIIVSMLNLFCHLLYYLQQILGFFFLSTHFGIFLAVLFFITHI
jgi:hypothetical protein